MPIFNREDARDVDDHVEGIFAAPQPDRASAIRALFVEKLDFNPDSGHVDLAAAPAGAKLPKTAERVAQLDGVHVLYVALNIQETNRVRKTEAAAAARLIAAQLGEDMLLVFTNTSYSQLHFIHPDFDGAQPTLRRMVVERDLPRRTAVEQFSDVYWSYERCGSIRDALEEAFDVEPVTRKFFQEYKRVFEAAEKRVSGFSSGEQEEERLFVQTLFNRLMFVYFLSRKGWLTFKGDKSYLNALWNDYGDAPLQTNFYKERLSHLFFFGLNNYLSRDINLKGHYFESVFGEVPFLNGGLFDKSDLDERDGLTVPDDAIESVLTDLFDKFNFTVMESTPFDIEVAVDPEMLGKVFEELVTGRHESGSYYTPRPVVSFMCREALKGYLEGRDTGLSSEAVARFVDERDTSRIPLASASRVADALDQVTVVDPACGSGAYLLGMMQELVELQTELYNVGVDPRGLYGLKLHIIQRNLYGVDNDEFAVNIAMLRMWLSLTIEYEGDTPEPLPNLDFKVVCGDSLLGPDPSHLNLERGLIERSGLGSLKAEYMLETRGSAKSDLKRRIDRVEEDLRGALGGAGAPEGSVDWRIAFAEVFAAGGGFDVVLANPPYVVIKDRRLRTIYREGIYGRMNSYGIFIQRSLQLMSEGAQLFFINPRTLLTDRYFTNLRKVIREKSELKGVVLIADRHNTFERVLQECIILHLARKTNPSGTYVLNTRSISIPTDLNDPTEKVSITSDRVLLGSEYDGSFYVGKSEFDYQIFERMNSVAVKLSDLGLKAETGKIQFDKCRDYALPTNAGSACRLIWAENIQRYAERATRKRIGKEWLSDEIRTVIYPNITGAGIVTQRTSANEQPRRIIATLITPEIARSHNVYSENGTNFISLSGTRSECAFLIGALNSSLMEFVFRRLNSNVHVSSGEINQLPFPPIPDNDTLSEIEKLVFDLLTMGGVDCQRDTVEQAIAKERRLDELIGSLYGLSASEVEQVQRQLPAYETVYE